MAKATPCKDALAKWAAAHGGGEPLESVEKVEVRRSWCRCLLACWQSRAPNLKSGQGTQRTAPAAKREHPSCLTPPAALQLCGLCPPIEKMDSSLSALRACRLLSLSTNNLDKIGNLAGLDALQVEGGGAGGFGRVGGCTRWHEGGWGSPSTRPQCVKN